MTGSLLFVRVPPVASTIERAWTEWYDREHIAYRLSMPGFLGARRYHVAGGPIAHLALYELTDPSALTSAPYLAHRRWEEALKLPRFEAIAPHMPGFQRGVYQQQAPRNRAYSPPDCASLLIVDLDEADRLWKGDASQLENFVAGLEGIEDVFAVRVLTLASAAGAPGSGRHTGGPHRLALIDCGDVVPRLVETLQGAWEDSACPDFAAVSTCARRAYSSFHPSPPS